MKFLLLFLITLPAFSNTFELTETGSRFKLVITKNDLMFSSESLNTKVSLRPCSFQLAKNLNNDLLSKLPRTPAAQSSIKIKVDNEDFGLSPKDDFSKIVFSMEQKVSQFLMDERAACK